MSTVMATATATTTVARFSVNGQPVEYAGPGGRRLLDVLRVDLGLTGTKEGCGEGECGACSVLLDGRLAAACLVPVCQADGADVRTVEGMVIESSLEPLQAAFLDTGAVQCGFCTPGMLVAARAFLDSGAEPSEEAIRTAIAGNLCRCTGYTKIVEAIAATAATGGRPAWRTVAAEAVIRVGARDAAPNSESPATLEEALALLAERPCRPIAGGTDLMVGIAPAVGDGALGGRTVVDLSRIASLRTIGLEGTTLVVGATATFTDLRRSLLVQEHLPALAQIAATVGAVQVQNRGTIGGNIVTASPAGDMLPLLLATDATFVLASVRGERQVAAESFFVAYRRTALAPDELLVAVRIPLVPAREIRVRKVGTRRAQAISKVALAVSWLVGDDAERHDVRVAAGSVAPLPMRCRGAEAELEGTKRDPAVARRAAQALEAEISPIDDVRSTADYRRIVAGRVLERLVS